MRRVAIAALAVVLTASNGAAAAVAYLCSMDGAWRSSCCCDGMDMDDGTEENSASDDGCARLLDNSGCCAVDADLTPPAPGLMAQGVQAVRVDVALLTDLNDDLSPNTTFDGAILPLSGAPPGTTPLFVRHLTLLI